MSIERAIWHPFWYELDQSLEVGCVAQFEFFSTAPNELADEIIPIFYYGNWNDRHLYYSAKKRILAALLILTTRASLAQDTKSDANPFGAPSNTTETETEWTPLHPDGDTPQSRMLSLVHTDALPRFDRAELYAVSFPDRKGNERPKSKPTDKTFPVRPYGVHADVHAHVTLKGDACDDLHTAWQSLAFDSLGGAFCHYPGYGLKLYRGKQLLFETTVCWECQNFYLPQFDPEKRRYTHGWYGFANDDKAKTLLKLLRSHLPHPKL